MERNNNFDFLRIVFATFVIITHSYSLSGSKNADWLEMFTNHQLTFSSLGVKGFFIISGYLIFKSLERSQSLIDYFWKRFLRLFPGLFVVLTITIILGPFVYESDIPYVENTKVWSYIPNNLSLYNLQYNIPGIFENNPHPGAVNGSLWTIEYEFTLYVLLSLLFFIRDRIKIVQIALVVVFIVFVTANLAFLEHLKRFQRVLSFKHLFDLGIYFIAGSILASFRIDSLRNGVFNPLIGAAFLIAVISIINSFFYMVSFALLPIVIVGIGLKSWKFVSQIGNRIGDLSYGTYIYAFPIQQTLVYYLKLNWFSLMILSIVISYFFAYLSWHLVESKALRLKRLAPKFYFSK